MSLQAKLLTLLDSNYRKSFYWFLFVSVVFALLETAGLAFILPYLDVVGKYAANQPQDEFSLVLNYLGISADGIRVVYIASMILFALMFVKYGLQIYVNYLSSVLPYDLYEYHGNLLAKKYNRLEWASFSQKNSNEIIKNVTKSNELLAYSYVVYLQYLTSFIIIVSLLIILFVVNFYSAIVMITLFSILGSVTYLSLRRKQMEAGVNRELGLTAVFKQASELFLSNKEIKITGTSHYFENNFAAALKGLSTSFKLTTFYPRIPVVIIEMGAIVILLSVVLAAVKLEYDLEVLIGYLIFYAAVGKRLLPSISTLIFCKSTLVNLKPTIDNLYEELHDEIVFKNANANNEDPNKKILLQWSEISLENVSFSYNCDKQVLNELDFDICKNKSIAFIGPSGAGKSTIIDILTGLLKPKAGCLKIDGVEQSDFSRLKSLLGYVPQMPFILDGPIANNIAFGQSLIDEKKLEFSLKIANLTEFVNGLKNGVNTVVGERGVRLSGGQRQRISIARAVYNDPEIIVFDEATSALDNISEKIVSQAINALSGSKTIICVAHRLSTIKNFDVIYYVKDGRIINSGTHSSLMENCDEYRKMNEIVD
jgi:ATP-binding cassette subfamily C protein